ncbi:hypothetical protein AY606_07915 [Acinetobacter sp. SFB]|uniref:hypothetical protein n=1 Tax=Acinetobacter sp. SFB TaxID=1805634 RepID=UPI0007D8734F|nr:hypothetical protein [Acinetobacter sp. SFB]OAL78358.1 hypothetical protein AY606_07915 [Acinetobacter sp. SFB]
MLYQYHCACCDQVVESAHHKECTNCGSHNIKSPYGFWIFCVLTCLAAVIIFRVVHIYLQDPQEIPVQPSVLEVISARP